MLNVLFLLSLLLQCVTIKSCGQLVWELGCNRVIEVRLHMG